MANFEGPKAELTLTPAPQDFRQQLPIAAWDRNRGSFRQVVRDSSNQAIPDEFDRATRHGNAPAVAKYLDGEILMELERRFGSCVGRQQHVCHIARIGALVQG
jgi:hypothetical protein